MEAIEKIRRITTSRGGRIGACALLAVIASCGNNAKFDDTEIAEQRAQISPVERFVQDFVRGGVNNSDDNEGILFNMYVEDTDYLESDEQFGQTCFAGSAYDPTTSKITGRARGEISGIPTVVWDSLVPDELQVVPASSGAPVLTFTGYQTHDHPLQPADKTTSDQLQAYGCRAVDTL